MPMAQAATTVCDHYARGERVPYLEEARSVSGCGLHMVANRLPAAERSMPAFAELVVSQAVRHPFRFRANLGAGWFGGRALPMDFIVIPPRVPGHGAIHDRNDLRFLGIPLDLASSCLGRDPRDTLDFGALHRRHQRDPLIAHTLEALWQELANGEDSCRVYLETLAAAVVVRLQCLAANQARSREQPHGHGLAPRESARVIEYMRAHLDQPVTLRDLAGIADLSPCHLARAFRAAHGLPPHQYLIRMRIEHARELLTRTQWRITDVAAATGYSPQQFARHFRRQVGCTPSAYRHRTNARLAAGRTEPGE